MNFYSQGCQGSDREGWGEGKHRQGEVGDHQTIGGWKGEGTKTEWDNDSAETSSRSVPSMFLPQVSKLFITIYREKY